MTCATNQAKTTAKRRGASWIRTLVVAISTLSILIVFFTIYQWSLPPEQDRPVTRSIRKRVPPVPQESPPQSRFSIVDSATAGNDETAEPDSRQTASTDSPKPSTSKIEIGNGIEVGQSHGVTFEMYPNEGERPVAVFKVDSWAPVQGAQNEFHVQEPDVTVFTKSGHGVKARAHEGYLETRGKLGANTSVRRGRLIGDVVIRIDRLSEQERRALPEAERNDPSRIVTIRTGEIRFSYDYAKVTIPGPVSLTANDAKLDTENIEIRFNEREGRIETCHINGGGSLEVLQQYADMSVALPGVTDSGRSRRHVSDWFGATVDSLIAAKNEVAAQAAIEAQTRRNQEAGIDVPIFEVSAGKKKQESSPDSDVPYFAKFEGNVVASQVSGGEVASTLRGDRLTIQREFTKEDRKDVQTRQVNGRGGAAKAPSQSAGQPTTGGAEGERLSLTWSDRVMIEAVTGKPDQVNHPPGITAFGAPLIIDSGDGRAECTSLDFQPDGSRVTLRGDEERIARVQLPDQGEIVGREIYFEQDGPRFEIEVLGPGRLYPGQSPTIAGSGSVRPRRPSSDGPGDAATREGDAIIFSNSLQVFGHMVSENIIDLTGGLVQKQYRILDRADFAGRSTLQLADTALTADRIAIVFSSERTADGIIQTYRRLTGEGSVEMYQGADRLTSHRIEIELRTVDGQPEPVRATAWGNVNANQGARVIRCREMLMVDFDAVEKTPPPYDPVRAYHRAAAAGIDVLSVDWAAQQQRHERRRNREIVPVRLQATDEVFVSDAVQSLEVTGDTLDCIIRDGIAISQVSIEGESSRPGRLELRQFSLLGQQIRLDAEKEDAAVDGRGTMRFLSNKDLDGQRVESPIPISISWGESMRYRGHDNEAEFFGGVHAGSESSHSFDCEKLKVLFVSAEAAPSSTNADADWWVLNNLIPERGSSDDSGSPFGQTQFDKEPSYLLATGKADAMVENREGDRLLSRATIRGDQLSVDLRDDISRMLIEGEGRLLLEDFESADSGENVPPSSASSAEPLAFEIGQNAGPSKTLITWQRQMWYDFGRRIAQFEGAVDLRYFSGSVLNDIFGPGSSPEGASGSRKTFLACNTLAVSFDGSDQASNAEAGQIGGMSASSIKSFFAQDNVRLNDESLQGSGTEADMQLIVNAARISFDRDRTLLSAFGTPRRAATFTRRVPGQLPDRSQALRVHFNTDTGKVHATGARFEGRN
ncbi:MAG: hypothetical protein ACPGXK_04030 [Phycisphaerae bacterium]